jgi:hypothetical protein
MICRPPLFSMSVRLAPGVDLVEEQDTRPVRPCLLEDRAGFSL